MNSATNTTELETNQLRKAFSARVLFSPTCSKVEDTRRTGTAMWPGRQVHKQLRVSFKRLMCHTKKDCPHPRDVVEIPIRCLLGHACSSVTPPRGAQRVPIATTASREVWFRGTETKGRIFLFVPPALTGRRNTFPQIPFFKTCISPAMWQILYVTMKKNFDGHSSSF